MAGTDHDDVTLKKVTSKFSSQKFAFFIYDPIKVDQSDYVDDLNEMNFEVLIVKVASLGLNKKHVGKRLSDITPYLNQLKDSYGVHPAGEGNICFSFFYVPYFLKLYQETNSKAKNY